MKKESTMAKMGMEVVTMLELMGEVKLRPTVYKHWLHTMPRTAAPAISNTSRRGTCSCFTKREVSQKSAAAPVTLKETIEMPSTP